MRTISSLLSLEGRVYVYLKNTDTSSLFLKNAEKEGITFCDGALPTERHDSDIFALNRDRTINYVGWIGHMAFMYSKHLAGEQLVRVDYERFAAGDEDFVF